ncbi:MAG TPA: ergothioneine biosynthesis protein EgtB [Actinomycetes bacterium]|nr:ergothioneine biosynthesis protein EgtB [Actinomycetes bacterium]
MTDQLKDKIAIGLDAARKRTRALTESVDNDELVQQHSPIMSPLVWDLAHIGNQEELWLLRDVGGREPVMGTHIDQLYDAFKHPRRDRPQLPLLSPTESRVYVDEVRAKVLDVLESTPLEGRKLLDQGFAFGMITQHEAQHDETMLATHQLRTGPPALTAPQPPSPTINPATLPTEQFVAAGSFTMGTSTEAWALDNERPAHQVHVDAFWIDTFPITNEQYISFIDDGGYDQQRWWSQDGWNHVNDANLRAPLFWYKEGDAWFRRRFGYIESVPPNEPVQHVCWFEAEAFARWAGKRLPTEAEWEKAARHDPGTGRSRRFPWGDASVTTEHANVGQEYLQPSPVGSYPESASAYGVQQQIGDVWEWTASVFTGYPGFAAWPYAEYSEVFFDMGLRVLRGGAWSVDPVACRGTFRNWDLPIRRQIFAGFRCARDAEGSA